MHWAVAPDCSCGRPPRSTRNAPSGPSRCPRPAGASNSSTTTCGSISRVRPSRRVRRWSFRRPPPRLKPPLSRPRRAPPDATPRSRARRNRPARLQPPAPVTRHVPRRRPTPTRHQLPIRHQPSRAVHHPMTHHVRLWDGALQLGTRLPGNRRETPPGQASDPWSQPRSSCRLWAGLSAPRRITVCVPRPVPTGP